MSGVPEWAIGIGVIFTVLGIGVVTGTPKIDRESQQNHN